jgi:hypothetical protein
LKLPVNSPLFLVCERGPGINLVLKFSQMTDAATGQTLPGHGTQFALSNIEPTAMLGRINKVDAFDIGPGDSWFKGGVKSSFGMGVEVIHDKRDLVTISISSIQEMSDFKRPIFAAYEPLLAESQRAVLQT